MSEQPALTNKQKKNRKKKERRRKKKVEERVQSQPAQAEAEMVAATAAAAAVVEGTSEVVAEVVSAQQPEEQPVGQVVEEKEEVVEEVVEKVEPPALEIVESTEPVITHTETEVVVDDNGEVIGVSTETVAVVSDHQDSSEATAELESRAKEVLEQAGEHGGKVVDVDIAQTVVEEEIVETITVEEEQTKVDLPTGPSLDAAEAFKMMDINGDGTVDQEEFVAFMQAQGMAHTDKVISTSTNSKIRRTITTEEHVFEEATSDSGEAELLETVVVRERVEDDVDGDGVVDIVSERVVAIDTKPVAETEKAIEGVTESSSSTEEAVQEHVESSSRSTIVVETTTTRTSETKEDAEMTAISRDGSKPFLGSSAYRGSSATLLYRRPTTPQNGKDQLQLFMSLLCLDRYTKALLDEGYTVELLTPNSAEKAMELCNMTDYVDRFTFRRGIAAKENVARTKQVKEAATSVMRKLIREHVTDSSATFSKSMIWIPETATDEVLTQLKRTSPAAITSEEKALGKEIAAASVVTVDLAANLHLLKAGAKLDQLMCALLLQSLDMSREATEDDSVRTIFREYLRENTEGSVMLKVEGADVLEFADSDDEVSLCVQLVRFLEPLLHMRRVFLVCSGTCSVQQSSLPCQIAQIKAEGFVKVMMFHKGSQHDLDFFPVDTEVKSLSEYTRDLPTVTKEERMALYSDPACTQMAMEDGVILSKLKQRGSGIISLYVKHQPLSDMEMA